MAAVYPAAIATTTDLPDAGANLSTNPHSSLHNKNRDEIIALEAEGGVNPSGSSSTVAARFNTLWERIATGSPSAATSFDIAIPASTYRMVRIYIWGFVAAGTNVPLNARVNNDSTAALHRFQRATMQSDLTNTAVNTGTTEWAIGNVNNIQSATVELMLFDTDTSSKIPMFSKSAVYGTTEADSEARLTNGSLSVNRSISSLRIFPNSSTFTGGYFAEGMRP